MRKLRKLKRSLYNLFYYFKVVWNDRDWDHDYMWTLQLKKFEKAYKYRQSKWCMRCVGQEKQDQALRICINILKRLTTKDNYYMEFWTSKSPCTSISIEERDWKIYCKLIEKYQQTWWD